MMAVTTLLLEKEDCTALKILTIVQSYEECITNQLFNSCLRSMRGTQISSIRRQKRDSGLRIDETPCGWEHRCLQWHHRLYNWIVLHGAEGLQDVLRLGNIRKH